MGRKKRKIAKKIAQRKLPARSVKRDLINAKKTSELSDRRCENWLSTQKEYQNTYEDITDEVIPDIESTFDYPRNAVSDSEISETEKNVNYLVTFACEWGKCTEKPDDFVAFERHVSDHVDNACAEQQHVFRCMWDLCSFKSNEAKPLRIHLYLHVQHSRLKRNGEQKLMKRKLPPCVIDSRRRNFIADGPDDWCCQWESCNWKFEKIYEFHEHLRRHCTLESAMELKFIRHRTRKLTCGWIGCNKVFAKMNAFITHIRVHGQEKLSGCPNCGSTFMNDCKFYTHFIRQSNQKPFQCVQCFKYFATEDLLHHHMYIHVNSYKCVMCDMTCPSPSALTKHIRYRHISERPFQCRMCSYRAVNKYDLEKHLTIKHEKPILECEEFGCDFTTDSYATMRMHDRNVHGLGPNIYCCHCCEKRFPEGRHLTRHLIRYHGFQLPSGHTRFLYRQQIDGLFRLQTMRMESLEVSQQLMQSSTNEQDSKQTHQKDVNVFISNIRTEDQQVSISLDITGVPHDTNEVTMNHNDANDMELLDDGDIESEIEIGADNKNDFMLMVDETSNSRSSLKSIDNFSVMQRYITGKKKNILIEMQELDASGNVVNMELHQANEFRLKEKTSEI